MGSTSRRRRRSPSASAASPPSAPANTVSSQGCRSPPPRSRRSVAVRPVSSSTSWRTDRGRARRGRRARHRTDAPAADGRAVCAEPAVSSVGRGEPHPTIGGRTGRYAGHRAGRPQDDAGPPCRGEVRGALRRRREPPDGFVGHGSRPGQVTWRQRSAWPRPTPLVRALEASIPVEIEVDTLDGLADAIADGADEVLIDNFDTRRMRDAVACRDEHAPG